MIRLPEVVSRTQGLRPRPRTQKKSEAKAKDQGHKRKCSPKKKKKGLHKNFSSNLHKTTFSKEFLILTIQKIELSSSRGQANFRGLEASRPRTSKCVLEDSTSADYFTFLWLSTLMSILLILAILTRNKIRMSIPKWYVLGC